MDQPTQTQVSAQVSAQVPLSNQPLSKEFDQMSLFNKLQPNQHTPKFDINKDFELRDVIEKTNQIEQSSQQVQQFQQVQSEQQDQTKQQDQSEQIEQIEQMIRSLPFINDNIRSNIKFGIEIYKTLNNFDREYIHSIINENSAKSQM